MSEPLWWEQVSLPEFAERAAAELEFQFHPQGRPVSVEFTGPCPRCRDPFHFSWPLELVRTAEAGGWVPVTLSCQCQGGHPGRPEHEQGGCGAYWNACAAGWHVNGRLEPGDPATPGDLAAARAVLAARAGELDSVRVAAAKWQAGLAGLLGLVTGSTVVTVGQMIAKLNLGWRVAAALLVSVSLVLAVSSLMLALKASGGTPRPRLTIGFDPVYDTHVQARSAAATLATAISLALGSLALFAAGVGVTWFAPPPPQPGQVVVVTTDSGVLCGTLHTAAGDTLGIRDSRGDDHALRAREVRSLTPVNGCP